MKCKQLKAGGYLARAGTYLCKTLKNSQLVKKVAKNVLKIGFLVALNGVHDRRKSLTTLFIRADKRGAISTKATTI